MDREQIQAKRQELIARDGKWTAHNIELADGIYTFDQAEPQFQEKLAGFANHLRRITQIVADTVSRPLDSIRVLDLACLEGAYGIELARHGAEVVGIEIRDANLEKARFASEALSLSNITFAKDDVRNLSLEKYGSFDVVLCLGILYHLDAPDVFPFVENIAKVCTRTAIVDTHIAVSPDASYEFRNRPYYGWYFVEHAEDATPEERARNLWSSIDNTRSFWLSRPSLFNLLTEVGFTSAYTCQAPVVPGQWTDRDTILAIKGEAQPLILTPTLNQQLKPRWGEQDGVGTFRSERVGESHPASLVGRVRRRLRRML